MGQGPRGTFLCCTLGRELVQRLGNSRRTEQVHLDGTVQGRVERDRCGAVDHDVAGGEEFAPCLVEREAVASDVAGNRMQAAGDLVVEPIAELAAESVETVVAEDLAPRSLGRSVALPGADDDHDLASGHASKQALDERGSDEACRPGHGDPPGGELVEYHECVSSTRLRRSTLTIQVVCGCQLFGGSERAGAGFFGTGRLGFGGV